MKLLDYHGAIVHVSYTKLAHRWQVAFVMRRLHILVPRVSM